MRLFRFLPVFAFLAACTGSDKAGDSDAGGTVVIAVGADPDLLLPPLTNTSAGRMVADQIFERLAELPPSGPSAGDAGYQPRLADKWDWAPDSLSIAFHVDPRARWHDGRPVRATDVAFSFKVSKDSTSGSNVVSSLSAIDSVTVRDSLTAVYWFARRYPNQFFDATFQIFIVPEHLLKDVPMTDMRAAPFARKPVGTGRFRFVSWTANQRLELIADTANYRGRPPLDRIVVAIAPDYAAGLAKLMSGEADFYEIIRAPNIAEVAAKPDIRLEKYPNLQYAFMLFNARAPKTARPHPIFGDVAVRRALAMAIDRKAIVKNVLDSLGAVGIGPAPRAIATSDSTLTQPPFDLEGAKRMLDSIGWRAGADGMRSKGAQKLAFSLLTPTSSATRVKMAVLIQEMLRQAGAQVNVEQVDFNAQGARLRAHDFDAAMQVIATDPVPDAVLQSWGSGNIASGTNYGAYNNPKFDALVDSGVHAGDAATGRAILRRAYQTILDDAPAVWLFEPVLFSGKHKRLRTPNMRLDAWWVGIPEWSIPAAERIERDKIGLRTVAQ